MSKNVETIFQAQQFLIICCYSQQYYYKTISCSVIQMLQLNFITYAQLTNLNDWICFLHINLHTFWVAILSFFNGLLIRSYARSFIHYRRETVQNLKNTSGYLGINTCHFILFNSTSSNHNILCGL